MTSETQTPIEIKLTAHESKISDVGGIARINSDLLPHLKTKQGKDVEVYNKLTKHAVVLTMTADSMIPKDTINLRSNDMKRLDIKDGDAVYLRAHATIGEVLGEWKDKVIAKFKKDDKSDAKTEGDNHDPK